MLAPTFFPTIHSTKPEVGYCIRGEIYSNNAKSAERKARGAMDLSGENVSALADFPGANDGLVSVEFAKMKIIKN
jgi:hypothetical protein